MNASSESGECASLISVVLLTAGFVAITLGPLSPNEFPHSAATPMGTPSDNRFAAPGSPSITHVKPAPRGKASEADPTCAENEQFDHRRVTQPHVPDKDHHLQPVAPPASRVIKSSLCRGNAGNCRIEGNSTLQVGHPEGVEEGAKLL